MTEPQQHPSSPPQELIEQWITEPEYTSWNGKCTLITLANHRLNEVLVKTARWAWDQREPEIQAAADAELEACVSSVVRLYGCAISDDLRAARRPKPPSLKQCALNAHNRARCGSSLPGDSDIILHALEALPDG
jgi:hypothetical protein